MSKTIKFRAWDKINNNMFRLFDITSDGEVKIGGHKNNQDITVIMQYTGLKDKNGKEIYEGDIVKSQKYTYSVVWNTENARCGLQRNGEYPVAIHKPKNLEVIGNVYENPNLLKENGKNNI